MRDILRPIFRQVVKPHIKKLCKSTQARFEFYKERYSGQRCFIVANGPSLRMEDLDTLANNNEITFGMNRIYIIYDRTKWRPTYYMIQDPTVIRTCHSEILKYTKDSIVFAKVPGEPKYDISNAINFDVDYTNALKNIPPEFLDGIGCIFADGRSVTYTAIQLAVYMGFTTIHLLGTDCNYSIDNKSISQSSYPDKRMYDPKKVGMLPNIAYTFLAYESAKKYTEACGTTIYNASRGGMLEVFERVNFDSLF